MMHGHGNSFIPEVILVEETRIWWYSEPTNYKPSCECLHWSFDHPSPQNLTQVPQQGFLIQRDKYSATIHFRPRPCTLWRLLLLFNKGYSVSLTECLIVSLGSIFHYRSLPIDRYLRMITYERFHTLSPLDELLKSSNRFDSI